MIDEILQNLGKNKSYLLKYINKFEFEEEYIEEDAYIKIKKTGFSFMIRENSVDSVIFYDNNTEGYDKYRGELPFNLKFSMSRDEVHLLLGDPSFIREARIFPILGFLPSLDRYDVDGRSYAISYNDNLDSISRINVFTS